MISALQEALQKTLTPLYQYESSLPGPEGPAKIRPPSGSQGSHLVISVRGTFSVPPGRAFLSRHLLSPTPSFSVFLPTGLGWDPGAHCGYGSLQKVGNVKKTQLTHHGKQAYLKPFLFCLSATLLI